MYSTVDCNFLKRTLQNPPFKYLLIVGFLFQYNVGSVLIIIDDVMSLNANPDFYWKPVYSVPRRL